ncbi:MAG: hypothetical protein RIM99_03460 [Cyclobacteriaceae bacterium]
MIDTEGGYYLKTHPFPLQGGELMQAGNKSMTNKCELRMKRKESELLAQTHPYPSEEGISSISFKN